MVTWSKKERDAWRPLPDMNVAEWARENLYLSRRTSPMPGLYRPDFTPYVFEPLECFTDERIEKIVLCWATQTSKTTVFYACMGYGMAWDPGPMLLVMTSREVCDYTSNNRIQPIIEDCPSLISRFPPRHKWKLAEMPFDGGVLSLVGANSPGQLASRPVRYLFLDELAKFPHIVGREASAQALAEERTNTFPMSKIMEASTPVVAGDAILSDLKTSDYRKYYVPCPFCGAMQVLAWKQMRWPHDKQGKSISPNAAEKRTTYECVSCKKQIEERHKRWMLTHGKWIKRGQKIKQLKAKKGFEWSIKLPGRKLKYYKLTGNIEHNSIAGFWINALYSPFPRVTWGKLVRRFLDINDDLGKLQNFVNSVLCEAWKQRAVKVDESKLADHIWSDKPTGVVPDGYEVVTMGVDVQLAYLRYSVWAWREDGACHLVENGEVAGFRGISDVLTSRWQIGSRQIGVAMCFVDSGYRTTEVYDFCRGRTSCMACKGSPSGYRGLISTSSIEKYPNGKPMRNALRLANVFVDAFKDEFHSRIGIKWDRQLPDTPERYVSFHTDITGDFFKELAAEERVEKQDARGRVTYEWVRKGPNHDFDTTIYARAAYNFIGLMCWQWIAKSKAKRKTPASAAASSRSGGMYDDLPEL